MSPENPPSQEPSPEERRLRAKELFRRSVERHCAVLTEELVALNPDIRESDVRSYLEDQYDERLFDEFLEVTFFTGVTMTVNLEIRLTTETRPIIPEEHSPEHKVISKLFDPVEEEQEFIALSRHPEERKIFLKKQLLEIRSWTLLFKLLLDEEPRGTPTQSFQSEFIQFLKFYDIPIPERLKVWTRTQPTSILEETMQDTGMLKERTTKDHLEAQVEEDEAAGIHPSLIERRMTVGIEEILQGLGREFQHIEDEFRKFLDAFDNPVELFDLMLGLKDGKFPVELVPESV